MVQGEMRPNLGHEPLSVENAVQLELKMSCGDGLKGVPLSQTLFSVAEESKQDICVYKCRKPGGVSKSRSPAFLL